jgi:hypothetical protein
MTGYTRQEIFNSGDVIEAAHGNNELNQIVSAFAQVTGHRHNGTAAEGAFIPLISNAANTDKVEVVTGGAKTTGTHQVTGVITADVGVTATTNGFTATAGDITATAGNVVLTAGNVTLAALATVDGRDVSVDGTKLDGIETAATADQVAAEVPNTPAGSIIATNVQTAINELDTEKAALAGAAFTGAITTTSTVDGRNVSVDGTKLDGVETAATADQTGAEIKTAYQAEVSAFTDAQFTKLAAIETAATADQSAAEVVFTATGNIVATDVQAAIAEVDTEKAALAGATFTGAVTVPAFTSTGIDDNATGERLQIADTGMTIGSGFANYGIVNAADDQDTTISGGSGETSGANMVLFGGTHTTSANDIRLRGGGSTQLEYDDSASLWDFQANAVTTTGALTCGTFTSTGIDDNASGERLQVGDTATLFGDGGTVGEVYSLALRNVTTGEMQLIGGSSPGTSSNISLFGGAHATLANDIKLSSSAALQLHYDDSASLWDFRQNQIVVDQGTADNGLINFQATIDADATSAISSLTTSGATTHHIQVEINGTTFWIAGSTTDPS